MLLLFQALAQKSTQILIAAAAAVLSSFSQPNIQVIKPTEIPILPAPTSTIFVSTPTSTEAVLQTSSAKIEVTNSSGAKNEKSSLKNPAPVSTPASQNAAKTKKVFPKIATVQSILDGTTFSLNRRADGTYLVSLRTDTGDGSGFSWGFADSSIGGVTLIPQMNVSFSCNPQWISPPSNSSDQNPIFDINTSYDCDIQLTDSLLRTADKKISFKTENGRLIVRNSALSTLLQSGSDNNGFVFENQSDSPITIASIVADVSFRSLNTSSPIVFRIYSPNDESSFSDFQIQDSPPDPLKLNFKTTQGIIVSLPFTFTVNARDRRLLPVEILGVQPLNEIGINPEIDVTLKQVNYDNQSIKISFVSSQISWSCVPYDALTSGGNLPNESNCR